MKVRTSSLNEDLARIEHIFTDKSGTLTQNVMWALISIISIGWPRTRRERRYA